MSDTPTPPPPPTETPSYLDGADDVSDSEVYEDQYNEPAGWYMAGDGDNVYRLQGECEDTTACDSECGYCGRCEY